MPAWSVPPGLLNPDRRRAPQEQATDDAAWPGAAPPARWFLRAPAARRPANDAMRSLHREPDGSWSTEPAAPEPQAPEPQVPDATPARRGRPGGPGFQPDRSGAAGPVGLSPWQQSHRAWQESGIQWQLAATLPQSASSSPQTAAVPLAPLASPRPAAALPPQSAAVAWAAQPRWPNGVQAQFPLSAQVFTDAEPDAPLDTEPGFEPGTGELAPGCDLEPDAGYDDADDVADEARQDTWAARQDKWADDRPPIWERPAGLVPPPRRPPSDTLLLDRPQRAPMGAGAWPGLVSRRTATIAVPALVLMAVAVLALALLMGHGPKFGRLTGDQNAGSPQSPLATASLATYKGQQSRGVFQTINRIVASGGTMVAIGSQASDGLVRQQFFVSADGGRSWRLAPVRGRAPLGHPASLLAGGRGGWLAIGPRALWASADGMSWTLAAPHGIRPQLPGDSVWVITRTARGYLAAGAGSGQAVLWRSAGGLAWQRESAGQLGLAGPGESVRSISYATCHGTATVISGQVARGGRTYSGQWLSTDGGRAWTRLMIPAGHGAAPAVSGLGSGGSGMIAVRPGVTAGGAPDGVAYFSPDGRVWRYAGMIGATPGSGWSPRVVKGSDDGFVVTGTTARGAIVAYASTGTGSTWRPAGPLGDAGAGSLVSATVAPHGIVVAAGYTAAARLSQQPLLLEADTAGAVRPVPVDDLPGALIPELTVSSLAAAGGQMVAVGSADGYPAAWRKTAGGSWSRALPLSLASAYPGLTALTSVTHGPSGWLAVGAPGPIVLTSADGVTWRQAGGTITRNLAGVSALATASGPAGYTIVGKLVAPGGGCVADVWWSPDLAIWTRAHDVNLATGSSQVLAVAADARGFVSAGSHNGKPALWTTTDGRSWRTIVLPVPVGATGGVLQQIAIKGNRVAALGQAIAANGSTAPLAEVSADGGSTWRQVPFGAPGPEVAFTALTVGRAGFTAAGQFGASGQQQAAVWTSPDGARWSLAPSPAGPSQITALAPSGPSNSAVTGVGSVTTQQSHRIVTMTLP